MKTAKCTVCCSLAAMFLALFCVTLFFRAAPAYADDSAQPDAYRDFIFTQGTRPDYDSLINSQQLALVDAALEDGASAEALKRAAIALYDAANESRKGAHGASLMLQESYMGIKNPLSSSPVTADFDLDDAFAVVKMRGFTIKSGEDWFNQFAAAVVNSGAGGLLMSTLGVSTMVKMNYHLASEPDKYYFNIMNKPSEAKTYNINCDLDKFPYQSFSVTQKATAYSYDDFKEEANILDAPNEIYNMEFVPEILGDDVTIEHEDGLYKVHFTVDPNADRELLEQWYRLPKKDMAAGGQTLNAYLKYICDLEVWDNGYVKSYFAEYTRDAGMGSGMTVDKFNYIWKDDEIKAVISSDYRIEEMSALEKLRFKDYDDYIAFYIDSDIVKVQLAPIYIALIVIGCVAFAAIVAVVVVEILVRKGKLPKLAAKREAKKQRRLAKKKAKRAAEGTSPAAGGEDSSGEPLTESGGADEEPETHTDATEQAPDGKGESDAPDEK